MLSCKAIGCSNASGKTVGIVYYSVPKDKALATEWLVKCGIKTDDARVYNNAVVCSEHFLPNDFINSSRCLAALKDKSALAQLMPWSRTGARSSVVPMLNYHR